MIMLRKIINLMHVNRLWLYLIVTIVAGFTLGFAEALIAIGLTWVTIMILRNLFLTNDSLTKIHDEISYHMSAGNKSNIYPTSSTVNDTADIYSHFDEELVNPAQWNKKKLDEFISDPAYKNLAGNMWHH